MTGRPTHRMSRTKEYQVWYKIKSRCLKATDRSYARYGGRGITICENWLSFDGFLADMGRRPADHLTVERIDNDLGYEPGNCRWATPEEQQNNKRTTHFVEYRGQRMSIADAVRAAGSLVLRETARNRIFRGWPAKRAVETPNSFRRDPETRCIVRSAE